jgi:3-hydroxyacyl-CoA dehydrogenase
VADGRFYRVADGRRQVFGPDGGYHDIIRPDGVLLLGDIRLATTRLAGNGSAALWDIGDGVVCLGFTSKMNSLDPDIMALINQAVSKGTAGDFKALVIANDGAQFSVGANLKRALDGIERGAWDELDAATVAGQAAFRALRHAPFPVVGAVAGMALGGGCEILLHCDAVQAHAESYIGLVEIGVGLLPSWGGCATMLLRFAADKATAKGPMPAATRTFELIAGGSVSKSAADARDLGLLRATDRITMNRDRLLADAKSRALAMVASYASPPPQIIRLAGASGRWTFRMGAQSHAAVGRATEQDLLVCDAIASVLTGGPADLTEDVSEDTLYHLERQALLTLARTTATQDRIRHMLETGKPLRN